MGRRPLGHGPDTARLRAGSKALSRTLAGSIAAASLVGLALACRDTTSPLNAAKAAGLAGCPSGSAIFTTPPIDLARITGWVPLGNLNPPAHTFPTDHQYLYLPFTDVTTGAASVTVVAPGKVFITRARRTSYNNGRTDYSIEFSPCTEIHGEFGHVATVPAALLTRLGAFDQQCSTYSPDPSTTVTACYTGSLGFEVKAGDTLGTAGGPGVFGLDFSLQDKRVDPLQFANASRWHTSNDGFDSFQTVAASDYFAEPAKSQIAAKVGSYDGKTRRTIAPVGGTIEVDLAGTARGAWFNPGQPSNPESPHLAIVPGNVDPAVFYFSFGTTSPFPSTTRTFAVANSGYVNRNPAQVTADGQTYCYDFVGGGGVLLQLPDASTLRLKGFASGSCGGPGPFGDIGATVFTFVR